MKVERCPNCNSDNLGDQWHGPGRRLKQKCYSCGWLGPLRTPEQIPMFHKKRVVLGGFEYTIFDCYGHAAFYSHSYSTEEAAQASMEIDVKIFNRNAGEDGGTPYAGVLWPRFVEVEGRVYRE